MILLETAPTTTIDRPIPATLTCAVCPLARRIEDDRYVCTMSQTASDVVRGHWQATVSCLESITQHEAEQTFEPVAEVERAIAKTDTPAPAPAKTAPTAPATKKLLPLLVPVARIKSDIPACNFDPNELEILGELMLSIGGFIVPPVVVRDSGGYKVVSGHLQYHAAVLARQLNPRKGETIPAIVLESENQSMALAQLKMLRFAA